MATVTVESVESYCSPACLLFSLFSQNNRLHGTIKHIHSSHLSFCSRSQSATTAASCDYNRNFATANRRPQTANRSTLPPRRPHQNNIYSRPFWSDFMIPSCIFYLHANYTLLGRRANSLRGARSKGNGVITDEVYTCNGPIIISTYGRCKRRPLWGCREVSPRGPPRGSLAEVATRHVTAITKLDIQQKVRA